LSTLFVKKPPAIKKSVRLSYIAYVLSFGSDVPLTLRVD